MDSDEGHVHHVRGLADQQGQEAVGSVIGLETEQAKRAK
jgi:hypothetical protein